MTHVSILCQFVELETARVRHCVVGTFRDYMHPLHDFDADSPRDKEESIVDMAVTGSHKACYGGV